MLSLAAWAAFQFSWHSFRCTCDDKSPSLLIKKCANRVQNGAEHPTAIITHWPPHFVLDFLLSLCCSYSAQTWSSVIRTKICYCLFTQGPNLGRMGRLDLSLLSTVKDAQRWGMWTGWTPDLRTANKLCQRLAKMKCGVVSVWSSQFLSQCSSLMFLFRFFDSLHFLWTF